MVRAEKPKAKPKPRPKFTDKAQSERFIETARLLSAEQPGEAFERAVHTVLSVRSIKRSKIFSPRRKKSIIFLVLH